MTDYALQHLGFTYEGASAPILTDITCVLPTGKTTLLLGESGAGKTTLIEVLTHIAPEYHPGEVTGRFDCGQTRWDALSLKQMARHIGLVFQDPESQFCTYTVEDELAFGLENLSFPADEMEARITRALALLDITHLRKRPLHELSGGEKQRVAIACVLTPDPPLLIFDEPTSNLDPAGIAEVFALIDRLKTQAGKTILIVEHQLEFLVDKVEYLLVLGQDGGLLFSGAMDEGMRFLARHPGLNVHLPPAVDFFRRLKEPPAEQLLDVSGVARYLEAATGSDAAPDAPDIPQTKPAVLSCRELSLSFAEGPVLHKVDLDIRQGDFMAIVGPNGAGKTTLLHSLMGIYPQASGQITLFGQALKKLRKQKWDYAGIAFQNPEWQFVANSVLDEILYSFKKTRLSPEEKEQTAKLYLEQFGLWEKRALSPFVLSQGEKRRLSVASILVRRQKLLLLDEPTFGQDMRNQDELMHLMRTLNESGITIVMVSHSMDLVYRYCNRAVLLCQGQIAFVGTPYDLFSDAALCAKGRLEQPFWLRVSQQLPQSPTIRSADEATTFYSL